MPLDLVEASLHAGGEAGQKAVDIAGRAVIMPRTPGSVPIAAAVAVASVAGTKATNVTISRAGAVTGPGILHVPPQRQWLRGRQLSAAHPTGQAAGGPGRLRSARGWDTRSTSGTVGAREVGRPRLASRQGTRSGGARALVQMIKAQREAPKLE